MTKSILLILVGNRATSVVKVQKILTDMGCFIKTRLGIHDVSPETCTNTGLIILDLVGDETHKRDVVERLEKVPNVRVKYIELSLEETEA